MSDMVKWIPVSERLPSKKGYFLTYGPSCFPTQVQYYEKGKKYGDRPQPWHGRCTVTHWMPLPEPPGEENRKTSDVKD